MARKKYQDPHLADAVDRNAADSARKLGAKERLWGPALLCYDHGKIPQMYTRAIAAALMYQADDEGTQAVNNKLESSGIATCLEYFAGEKLPTELVDMVKAEYAVMLKEQQGAASCN
ncbi:MAG: hypothetical protein HRU15_02970 [Planctomycetes bacterium]|nr:hypothetical protein [Planctomycetota bacterium]